MLYESDAKKMKIRELSDLYSHNPRHKEPIRPIRGAVRNLFRTINSIKISHLESKIVKISC
jgi:hypothetical protein